jgi:CysZ protein
MFDAAIKALSQMFSPEFRRVLFKSVGLALLMIILIGIGLNWLFDWLTNAGSAWAEASVGGHTVWNVISWIIKIAAALGVITGAIFLMPAVTAFVGSFFVDEIGEIVERTHYPAEPPGRALPLMTAMIEGIKPALLAIAIYLCALPFLLFAGLGLVIMFFATAWLLSREYFLLAAMRFRSPDEAKAMRRANSTSILIAGLPIALFVSIPIVNLATPLFAMAMMVHVHKRLSGQRVELIPPRRGQSITR